ncbi:hypothetical protein [Marinicella rhabdoformis]|uniref:hypothetical protein n=1 Tax=Marinicella rhabdoformis TaxID=2580566 RepID=UPI0012AEDB97|nr:hypothetical protein [Marinicella rhabdoformis]
MKAAKLPQQSFSHMVYSRLGYGVTPGLFDENTWSDIAGASDADKLRNFINNQMSNGTDVDVNARISESGNFETLNKSLNQLWVDYKIDINNQTSSSRPIYEMKRLKFTRAAYSLFPMK